MGQRHQIYVRIHNPLKNKSVVEDLKSFDSKGAQLKHAQKVFGTKKTSVLAFHHQWLFGMSAAAVCNNILREVDKSSSPVHILSKEIERLPYPSNYNGEKDKVDGFMEVVEALLFNQFDTEFAEQGARYGIERVCDLVDEQFDRKKGTMDIKRGDYRTDFTLGDNNDGITIIDVVEKKYCFMNIGFGDSTVMTLPALVPIPAEKYVNAYYATQKAKLGEYYIEDVCKNDETKIQELLQENKESVKFVKEKFAKRTLFTLDELKKIFPKVYKKTKKAKAAI
jgi:hypothetical protein